MTQFLDTQEAILALLGGELFLTYLVSRLPIKSVSFQVVPDISPEIKSCQLLESELCKVRRTGERSNFLPDWWQDFVTDTTDFEFELFLVNVAWASKGKRLREYRLRQSKEKHTIKKLSK